MQNLSYENKFNLHEKELVHEAHFQMNGTKTRLDTESKGNSEMASCLGHCSIKANNEITACNYSGSPPYRPQFCLSNEKFVSVDFQFGVDFHLFTVIVNFLFLK